MESRRVKQIHLKIRILRNLFVVMAVSMLISTIVSYLYFERVVREQKIAEEESKLNQVSNQLVFMVEDIQNMAHTMIADEDIQAVIEPIDGESAFDIIKKKDVVSKRLRFYNNLRPYISGSFIEMEEGEGYSSSSSNAELSYLEQKWNTKEIKDYKEQEEWIFSDPYYGIDSWDSRKIVCYGSGIWNKYNYGEKMGTLYLEVSLDYFLDQVESYGEESENVCLLGNQGTVLYAKSSDPAVKSMEKDGWATMKEGIHQVDGGYLICKDIQEAGWRICVLITNAYLFRQCSFVPTFFLLSFLISITAILLTTSRLMEKMIRPITALSQRMEQTDYEQLSPQRVAETGDEIQTLYECYNRMVEEIQRGMGQKMEYEKQKKDMEFDIMLSQINPHYLYNVLNTVVYLSAAGKSKEVVKIANALIFSLQETLRIGEKNIETTVKKELELTECYLEIQKYRYPDMFRVEIHCPEHLLNASVPKTIIQPLVENAILHGILPTERKGKIEILVSEEAGSLFITITDDGEGISGEVLQMFENGQDIIYEKNGRKHVGISNVRDRMKYLYGEPFGMKIERNPKGGTQVTLQLPLSIKS